MKVGIKMRKKFFKLAVSVFAGVIFCSATAPYAVFANEVENIESAEKEELGLDGDSSLNTSEEDADVYTLTAEDEAKISQAVDNYLAASGFNPLMQARGFGKKWWNSRSFVGNVIDAALIVVGIGSAAKSGQAAMKLIRANRRNITRVIEKQIANRIGISVSGILSSAFDFVGTISGYFSVGYLIACGLDKADRRYDGYILA
ncbi:hypothetical protein [Enterococcus sp. AZ177]|uniref:hypothetical protein n=1 Tax=unclassified Enterococcus TaxID=2608891 RepID=UPI003D2FAE3D